MEKSTYKLRDWPVGEVVESFSLPDTEMYRDMLFQWLKSQYPEQTLTVSISLEVRVDVLRKSAEHKVYHLGVGLSSDSSKPSGERDIIVATSKTDAPKQPEGESQ